MVAGRVDSVLEESWDEDKEKMDNEKEGKLIEKRGMERKR